MPLGPGCGSCELSGWQLFLWRLPLLAFPPTYPKILSNVIALNFLHYFHVQHNAPCIRFDLHVCQVVVVSLTWLPALCEKILSPSVASCQAMESNNEVLRKEIKHPLIHTNEAYMCILYAHIVHVYMNYAYNLLQFYLSCIVAYMFQFVYLNQGVFTITR